jgi:hypothetical protein
MPEISNQPAQTQTSSVISQPSGFNWKKVLIVVFIGAALLTVVAGAYYYLYGFKQTPTGNNQIEIKKATTSAQKDETAGWKTYTSSTIGFSISYPSNWKYSKETIATSDQEFSVASLSKSQPPVVGDIGDPLVSISKGPLHKSSYDSVLAMKVGKSESQSVAEASGVIIVSRLTNTKVDGLIGLQKKQEPTAKGEGNFTYLLEVYVEKNGEYYEISLVSATRAGFNEVTHTFELMISTFKFLP